MWVLLLYAKDKIISFNLGWTFGFGYFISNLYWITNSLTFEDIFKPLIPFALILIPLFLGLFYGFSTLVFSFLNPQKNLLSGADEHSSTAFKADGMESGGAARPAPPGMRSRARGGPRGRRGLAHEA